MTNYQLKNIRARYYFFCILLKQLILPVEPTSDAAGMYVELEEAGEGVL